LISWCVDEKRERWVAHWLRQWVETIAPGRAVLVHQTSVSDAGDGAFVALPRPEPGGRLALFVRVHSDLVSLGARCGANWLKSWAAVDLLPEVPHICDPTPGDPRFSLSWLTDHDVVAQEGHFLVGCILARTATPDDLAARSLYLRDDAPSLGLHFPLEPGDRLPIPLERGTWTASQVAEAYGLTPSEAAPLLNEMLCTGTAQWAEVPDGPPHTPLSTAGQI
jgi:hypothetical protein